MKLSTFLIQYLLRFSVISVFGADAKDEEIAAFVTQDRIPDFYVTGKGTPAQFISDRYYLLWKERITFRDKTTPESYDEAVQKLADYGRNLRLGLEWGLIPQRVKVAELTLNPQIDGDVKRDEWKDATCFPGEYPLNKKEKDSSFSDTQWYVGRTPDSYVFAAEFRDSSLSCGTGTRFSQSNHIYGGDCFELFLRPDTEKPYYYEFLINPDNKKWTLRHKATPMGVWEPLDTNCHTDAQAAAHITPTGFSVELKIPRALLGDSNNFSFMMIRTNRDQSNSEARKATCVPLLYDGHNLHGFILSSTARGSSR